MKTIQIALTAFCGLFLVTGVEQIRFARPNRRKPYRSTLMDCRFYIRSGRSRTDTMKQLGKLGKEIQGRECIHFTSKYLYENYLLNPEAIAAVINEIDFDRKKKIPVVLVQKWIQANKNQKEFYHDGKIPEISDRWETKIHGANFLSKLFKDLIVTKGLPYDKKIHSVKLTEWILANSPIDFEYLSNLLNSIISETS